MAGSEQSRKPKPGSGLLLKKLSARRRKEPAGRGCYPKAHHFIHPCLSERARYGKPKQKAGQALTCPARFPSHLPSSWLGGFVCPARGAAQILQPFGTRSVAAHRAIFAPAQADGPRKQPFEAVPKLDAIQHRVQYICHRAIMAVLRVSVMPRMMLGGLQHAMLWRNVMTRPFSFGVRCVHLWICWRWPRRGKQPDRPRQQPQPPRAGRPAPPRRKPVRPNFATNCAA